MCIWLGTLATGTLSWCPLVGVAATLGKAGPTLTTLGLSLMSSGITYEIAIYFLCLGGVMVNADGDVFHRHGVRFPVREDPGHDRLWGPCI